jgi:hypothetical protein
VSRIPLDRAPAGSPNKPPSVATACLTFHHNGSVKMEAQSLSTCNQCGKKFQRKAHLLRHQQQREFPSLAYQFPSSRISYSFPDSDIASQTPEIARTAVNSAPRPSNAGMQLLKATGKFSADTGDVAAMCCETISVAASVVETPRSRVRWREDASVMPAMSARG